MAAADPVLTPVPAADVALRAGLAFLAGATDVYGLGHLGTLYVSFMSGNTTMLGVAVGRADWARAGLIGGLVALFIAGAAGGAVLAVWAGARHRVAAVSGAVALLLALPVVVPATAVPAFVSGMAALNAATDRLGSAPVSLTYVTGTLVKLGQGLGRALCGEWGTLDWLWQLPLWLSLLAGAVAATLVRSGLGTAGDWPIPLLAAMLAAGALLRGPDPSA